MAALDGQVALVTGASRGLGYAAAKALAAEGAHVIALARTVGGLEELDDEISAAGGAATLVPLDINDDAGLERLGAAIHERWGRLDILLHAAAEAAPLSPAEHTVQKDMARVLKTNAEGVQRVIRVVDPLLRMAPAGQAVFIDDPAAIGEKFNTAYGASKAAAAAICRSYAAETRNAKISVWSAAAPPMPTAIRARGHPGEDRAKLTPCADVAARLVAQIAAGGPGKG